jgi:hypothetical protein
VRNPTRIVRWAIALILFVGTMAVVPAQWNGRDASSLYKGEPEVQRGLARTVVRQIQHGIEAQDYKTGSDLFSGEWLFGTYLMAGIGLCQLATEHPESKGEFSPTIEQCIEELLSPRVRDFDTRSWRGDALDSLEKGHGHAAYLGYFNVLLGLYRELNPQNRFAGLNDHISSALEKRLAASAIGVIETYPGERYPVDNAPALASIALHHRATQAGDKARLDLLVQNFRRHAVDPKTGLLYQSLAGDGRPVDRPRGSGTSLASFFLGVGRIPLGRDIFHALNRELAANVAGFGAIREYPRGIDGREDIDSGPIVFGFGCSATGFSIGGARMFGYPDLFHRLWASAVLAGAPIRPQGRVEFVTAGPLGNAILLAMLTAPRPDMP